MSYQSQGNCGRVVIIFLGNRHSMYTDQEPEGGVLIFSENRHGHQHNGYGCLSGRGTHLSWEFFLMHCCYNFSISNTGCKMGVVHILKWNRHNTGIVDRFFSFFSFFLGFWRPNLITGLSGWRTPDYHCFIFRKRHSRYTQLKNGRLTKEFVRHRPTVTDTGSFQTRV